MNYATTTNKQTTTLSTTTTNTNTSTTTTTTTSTTTTTTTSVYLIQNAIAEKVVDAVLSKLTSLADLGEALKLDAAVVGGARELVKKTEQALAEQLAEERRKKEEEERRKREEEERKAREEQERIEREEKERHEREEKERQEKDQAERDRAVKVRKGTGACVAIFHLRKNGEEESQMAETSISRWKPKICSCSCVWLKLSFVYYFAPL